MVVCGTGVIAMWGILQSITIAGLMTVIEIGGLLVIIVLGAVNSPEFTLRLPEAAHALDSSAPWNSILPAMLLAFFAFIGFEGLANIAEEVQEPERVLPKAIFITLVLSTLLYVAVVWVALLAVPQSELAASQAPLSLVFERITRAPPAVISLIAIIATLNGVIAQTVMASRVLYGMAEQGLLPPLLGKVDRRTRTPVLATFLVMVVILLLAVTFPLEGLAEMTSRVTLVVFALVNAALVQLKRNGTPAPDGYFSVPILVPIAGLVLCVAMLLADLIW